MPKDIPNPTRTTRITNPTNGHQVVILDYRGSQHLPKHPSLLECDYCGLDVTRLWCMPTRAFGLELRPGRQFVYEPAGIWCACADCRCFVDARDLDGLFRRVTANNPPTAAYAKLLHGVVFECLEDHETLLWEAGDEFPVRKPAAQV